MPERWTKLIVMKKLPIVTNVQCNWSVAPAGDEGEREAIEQAVALVREQQM
jgi:hypothetical protein